MKTIHAFVGDFYHNHDVTYNALVRYTAELGTVRVVRHFIDDIASVIASNPDAILIAREDRLNPEEDTEPNTWLTPVLDDAIEAYVAGGGRFLALHAGIASYPETSKYVGVTKGYFVSHPPGTCQVRYHGTGYDFTIDDEKYFVNVMQDQTQVYLKSESEHGESLAAWKHAYGKGKVVCLCPTHTKDGYKHPDVKKLHQEAITWALEV